MEQPPVSDCISQDIAEHSDGSLALTDLQNGLDVSVSFPLKKKKPPAS